jgi:hypothetical protein
MDLWSSLYRAREILEQRKEARQVVRKEGWWPDTVYLILDEGDLGFHPEWQQKYVRSLIRASPWFFAQSSKNMGRELTSLLRTRVHIIIATHSPISLSDVPRSHAVFLQRRKSGTMTERWVAERADVGLENTFGANIHNLYRSSFFLTEHMLGAFAHDTIQEVIDDLNRKDVNPERAHMMRRVIDQIGEPVIRAKLAKMYEDKFGDGLTDEERERFYEEELRKIRSRRRDENR